MNRCDEIRRRLAEEGPAVGEEAGCREHFETCRECRALYTRLQRIESELAALPEHDAPDALVTKTLERVEQAPPPRARISWRLGNRQHLAGALAASVIIAAIFGLTYDQLKPYLEGDLGYASLSARRANGPATLDQLAEATTPEAEPLPDERAAGAPPAVIAEAEVLENEISEVSRLRTEGPAGAAATGELSSTVFSSRLAAREGYESLGRESLLIAGLDDRLRNVEQEETFFEHDAQAKLEKKQSADLPADSKAPTSGLRAKNKDGLLSSEDLDESGSYRAEGDAFRANQPSASIVGAISEPKTHETETDTSSHAKPEKAVPSRQLADKEVFGQDVQEPNEQQEALVEEGRKRDQDTAPVVDEKVQSRDEVAQEVEAVPVAPGYGQFDDDGRGDRVTPKYHLDPPQILARHFLAQIASMEGLTFETPVGYWSNTYIPGDPAIRLLKSQLNDWQGQHRGLADGAQKYEQPFDAPESSALAVYLHADRSAVEGPTRMRLQVGLKGAERRGGHRPAMNVGLVVDSRELADAQKGARLRALVSALEESRQPGDRFSLVMAGDDGGVLVEPEAFRHGPLSVAIERILSGKEEGAGPVMSLEVALSRAAERLRRSGDPSDGLKPGLLLLASGAPLADDLPALERLAHVNAVGGIPLSVVSLGGGQNPDNLDRLSAAGQGRRWIMDSPGKADSLIDRELHASSRAVARAIRLRIRLEPHVKLIGVLGSQRLEEIEADRVREAEQAIDHRLARNLGIQADRGEDEEGIQIVIPTFYAGDTHSILLDVVVDRPGPIADVTARYKDVAYLRNGVSRDRLSLPQGQSAQGPLERNVLKNLAALELASGLRLVARDLRERSPESAGIRLRPLGDLIRGLRQEVPGWSNDPELAADEALIDGYMAALGSTSLGDPEQRRYLARSLQYAAFRKLQSEAR